MDYRIIRLLERREADALLRAVSQFPFSDGKLTALGLARDAKKNLQLTADDEARNKLVQRVVDAMTASTEFRDFAIPFRVARPMFNRFEPGMVYGFHFDSALMGDGNPIRTDISMTLFLAPPDSYDGGELVIQLPGQGREEEIKLDAGEAIFYPADTMHRVAPVTRGCRLAAVTWIQSAIRDERLRSVFHNLGKATARAQEKNDTDMVLLLGHAYQNLLRHVAEN